MTDVFRWEYGYTNSISCPVASASVIEIGDLVSYNSTSDAAESATGFTWTMDLATTQENFHDVFLGVAMERSRAGDTARIRVATTGVFRFATPSATYDLGTFVGPDKAAGDAILAQTLETVATANLGVGRVVRKNPAAATEALVAIVSTIIWGGPQAAA